MTELVLTPLADAFLQVGVFVALMLVAFGYLQHRCGERFTRFLAARWRTAPLFGAVLGVVPGCGGAIVVMPLYLRGTVSFGTVVAALVATMGDASFVLLATDLRLALVVHGALLVSGIVSGYAVDALGITPRSVPARAHPPGAAVGAAVGASVGAAEAFPPPRRLPAAQVAPLGLLLLTFWGLWAAGILVAVPVTFWMADLTWLSDLLGGVDPWQVLGVVGTLCAAAVYLGRRMGLRDDSCTTVEQQQRSVVGMLRHAAHETAFVTTWVAVAYLLTTWGLALGDVDLAVVAAVTGVAGVAVGALVGLVPGCALQVLLTGAFATGVVPLPLLLANAASQDGDALFPLLAMDRRAAALAAGVTTVPGILLGLGWLLLG